MAFLNSARIAITNFGMKFYVIKKLNPERKLQEGSLRITGNFGLKAISLEKYSEVVSNDNLCLSIWFRTAYYLCMCPFRVQTLETGHYKIQRNLIQNILCTACMVSSMWMYISELKPVTDCIWVGNKNPADYLNVFFKLTSIAYQIIFMYTMWTKVNCFMEIFKTLSSKYSGKKICPPKWFQTILCNAFFIAIFIILLTGKALAPDSHVASCRRWSAQSQLPLGLNNSVPDFVDLFALSAESNYTCTKVLLIVLIKMMNLSRLLMGLGKDCFMLMTCLTLWFPARAFAKQVHKSAEGLTREILQEYEMLKELSTKINEATSPLFFTFITEAILFYAVGFKYVLILSPTGISVLVFFFTFFVCFFLAADVCKQVGSMKKILGCPQLLQEDSPSTNSSAAVTLFLLNELGTNPVGLSANGMFVINYSLTASVCGSLLTYFIVIVQFDN